MKGLLKNLGLLIILVGVDLETMRQLDALMKMHHHDGFVDARKRRFKKF